MPLFKKQSLIFFSVSHQSAERLYIFLVPTHDFRLSSLRKTTSNKNEIEALFGFNDS